jgi:hypothetical protein
MQDPEDPMRQAGEAAEEAAGDMADAAGDAAAGAADAVGDAAQATGDAVSDAAQATGDAAGDVAETVSDAAQATGDAAAGAAAAAGEEVSDATAAAGEGSHDLAAGAVVAAGATAAAAGTTMQEAQTTVAGAVESATAGAEAPMTPSSAQPLATPEDRTVPAGRPTGITVLGTVAVLWGLFKLLFALPAMGMGMLFTGVGSGIATGTLMFIGGLIWLAIGIGFFKLKPWTWMLALVVAGLGVLEVLVGVFMEPGSLLCGLFGLIVPGILLWYLTRPHVKAAFGR